MPKEQSVIWNSLVTEPRPNANWLANLAKVVNIVVGLVCFDKYIHTLPVKSLEMLD